MQNGGAVGLYCNAPGCEHDSFKSAKRAGEPPAPKDPAVELLQEAIKIVAGARRQAYGTPEDNFQVIADLWNAVMRKKQAALDAAPTAPNVKLRVVLSSEDVALFMTLVKVARLAETPEHRDSWVDIAGYAGCGIRCVVSHEKE
jgi:hypothetical protein